MNVPSRRIVRASLPRVAVAGRPNVGKSTLVNRVLGRRQAIVEEKPGVTRDTGEHVVDWGGRRFVLIDTGGWESAPGDEISSAVRREAERAIAVADVVVLVCDGTVGVTQEDAEAARVVLRSAMPSVLAVNKVDGEKGEGDLADFYGLGLGDPHPVSALHGRRSGDLLDAILAALPEAGETPEEPEPLPDEIAEASVAIVGRPNVGKSTLFNRMIGEQRSIVHDAPGTTRDAVDTVVDVDGTTLRFVDTAGLRRKAKVDDRTEFYSRVRAIDALGRAEAALLVINARDGVTAADQKVAEEIVDAGSACVILLNQWDLLDPEEKLSLPDDVADKLWFLGWAPVLRVSAKTGQSVQKIVPTLNQALEQYRRRVPTHQLWKVVEDAQQRHPPPMEKGPTRIKYVTQARHSPPTFVMFANHELSPQYLRYLDRRIREAYGFEGTPLRLKLRVQSKGGPGGTPASGRRTPNAGRRGK